MKTPGLLTAWLLAVAQTILAIDVSEYVTPFSVKSNFNFYELPHTIVRHQNTTEFCRAFPGDKDWPSDAEWSTLNTTLNGALIKPVPRAAVCHSDWPDYYNEQKCEDLLANWIITNLGLQIPQISSTREPAIRVGAGVSLGEFYQAAEDHGVTAVGGECSTVGVAGGYSAGGGHSPSGGLFGMAADNIIELTAVLPNRTHALITSTIAPDLFWAFRGGGGSTFGIVTSIIVKVHPNIYTTVSQWSFQTGVFENNTVTNETFWQGVKAYLDHIPIMADSGSQVFAGVTPNAGGFRFNIFSFVAVDMMIEEYDTLMAPFFVKLTVLGIDVEQNTTFHPSYYGGWQRAFPKINSPWDPNKNVTATGSRLIPRKNFEDQQLFNATFNTLRDITNLGAGFIFYTQKNTFRPNISYAAPNSINPAYRDSAVFLMINGMHPTTATPAEINRVRSTVTKVIVRILKKITPGSGTYMNEADVREDDWQQSFFGSNYERLLQIKNEVDPERLLWAKTAVGSEDWYIRDDGELPEVQTGRLCRKV
ncbi:Nn.00g112670.m01.CDS01 [Neocucurbitaria sp. VM-36]